MNNNVKTLQLLGKGWMENPFLALKSNAVERILTSNQSHKVIPILKELDLESRKGKYAIGFLSYEAAAAFGLPVKEGLEDTIPLIWFALIDSNSLDEFQLNPIESAHPIANNINYSQTFEEYQNKFDIIKDHIASGNTYQLNYTLPVYPIIHAGSDRIFHSLYQSQPVPYAALIETESWSVLSLSPELFLSKNGSRIRSSPMKGTRKRGRFPDEDLRFQQRLRRSEKDQAENIMIVDMVRNDLGMICEFGSIQVPEQFCIQPFRTVLQMTSTVEGKLKSNSALHEILQAAFPAASITGAPKHRTMEIIRELENAPRGVYCGAIGIIKPGGDFIFNVAIRTLIQTKNQFVCGVGSGIVWDSKPKSEYAEVKTKTRFLTSNSMPFELIETMLLQKDNTLLYLDDHLNRLEESADYFHYPFHRERIESEIDQYIQERSSPCAVRMRLNPYGEFTFSYRDITNVPEHPVIKLSAQTIDSNDPFYFHKTTNRALYSEERETALADGFFEVIFQNEKGHITEGSITNIFVKINDQWYTPPISDGLLNGVWRKHFRIENKAVEKSILVEDLKEADEIVVGNSIVGGVSVRFE